MKISDKFILKEVGHEFMLIPVNNDFISVKNLITLNETSLAIYSYLKDGLTTQEIVDKMSTEYRVNVDELKSDVEEVIAKFRSLGVLDA